MDKKSDREHNKEVRKRLSRARVIINFCWIFVALLFILALVYGPSMNKQQSRVYPKAAHVAAFSFSSCKFLIL
jgi:hypothetical protein